MRASLIIASHNEGSALCQTIESSLASYSDEDIEIVVADDASDDGSIDEMRRRFPRVRLFRNEERLGTSVAKDLGARNAGGETLIFLDAHCKPEADAIPLMISAVELSGGRYVVMPRIATLDSCQWITRTAETGTGYTIELDSLDPKWIGLDAMRLTGRFYECPCIIGCCLGVSRAAYERVGGFDRQMRVWGVEDVDFGVRCWLMGYSIVHDPVSLIGHRFRKAFPYAVPVEHIIANKLRMALKIFDEPTFLRWLDPFRSRYEKTSFEKAWGIFERRRKSAEREKDYLRANAERPLSWYVEKFSVRTGDWFCGAT
jgi:GT2 family glycosyltransferase